MFYELDSFEHENDGIDVSAIPVYLSEKSDPTNSKYYWSYLIRIENNTDEAIQVLSRDIKITGDNGEHVVSYGTEAGQFQSRGYSAVICGPGSIAQAHQPNEFIEIAQFDAGAAFLEKMIGTMGTA